MLEYPLPIRALQQAVVKTCYTPIPASFYWHRVRLPQSLQGLPLSEPLPAGSKPGIDRLLIASALDPDLLRKLLESPDEAFQDFELTEEEQDLLRHPDHRLLPFLGAALAHQRPSPVSAPPAALSSQPHAILEVQTLPGVSLALTLVPCAQYDNGRLKLSYAVWVNPLPRDTDPASLPPPQGAVFPGQPLTPLYAVIQVSQLQMQDASGQPHIGLTAAFRQSTNMTAPPPPESAGIPTGSPFGSDLASGQVQTAIAAVRSAPAGQRYERLIDLLRVLQAKGAP